MLDLSIVFEKQFQSIFERTPCPPALREAAEYALFPGGKRFRPHLCLYTASHFGPVNRGFDVAAALEILHTYSLIHDDLPCLDDDCERRGKPTLHRAFGEATALLTGDFLLTWSFELLAKADHFSSDEKIALITLLSEAAGGNGMVGGQLLELGDPTLEELFDIYRGKTGKLIETAVLFGGIIGRAKEMKNLATFGEQIGLAFQLQDDIDDYEDDHHHGKTTLGTLLGKEKLKELIQGKMISCRQAMGEDLFRTLKPVLGDKISIASATEQALQTN